MERKQLKQLYEENFAGEVYINTFYYKVFAFQEFYLRNLHRVFAEGLVKGNTCIEIGCGPTVHSIASASKYCKTIITSDFLEGNRNKVKLWLKRDPAAIDWSKMLRVVSELEGFSNVEEGIKEIEERVRSKVTDVLHCDVFKEYPLEKAVNQCDVLITCLVLESATEKPEDYSAAIRNICNHLKPGGKIIVMGILNCTWYTFNKTIFPSVCVTRVLIENSLQSASCAIESFKEMESPDMLTEWNNSKRVFFCLAGKK